MIHALGFSETEFEPSDPGRLCRGRERWIEPWPPEPDEEPVTLHRIVISGARFSDDSAADAMRGLPYAGVDAAALIAALFPRKPMVAFMEDGHPADIPENATLVEAYEGYRAGGLAEVGLVRWVAPVNGLREIREVLGDPAEERVRGFVVLDGEPDLEDLADRIFRLVGMSTLDSPPARFQPAALPELLDVGRAVVLLHRDKHGPALGIYSRERIRTEGRLDAQAEKAGALVVPFAIPPMLARWDRALAELRSWWVTHRTDEFPVPPAPESTGWGRRRGRRERAPVAEE